MEKEKMERLLRLGLEKGASDIHFQVGCLPLYRFHGDLVELRYKVLTPKDTEEIVKHLLEQDPHSQSLEFSERDLAYELPGEGRFRVNISRQRRCFNIVLRVIPLEIKSFGDLNLPTVLQDIVIGPMLDEFVAMVPHRPFSLIVLTPEPAAVSERERGREKTGYVDFTPDELDSIHRSRTPELGFWLDSTDLTVEETVDLALSELEGAARVGEL